MCWRCRLLRRGPEIVGVRLGPRPGSVTAAMIAIRHCIAIDWIATWPVSPPCTGPGPRPTASTSTSAPCFSIEWGTRVTLVELKGAHLPKARDAIPRPLPDSVACRRAWLPVLGAQPEGRPQPQEPAGRDGPRQRPVARRARPRPSPATAGTPCSLIHAALARHGSRRRPRARPACPPPSTAEPRRAPGPGFRPQTPTPEDARPAAPCQETVGGQPRNASGARRHSSSTWSSGCGSNASREACRSSMAPPRPRPAPTWAVPALRQSRAKRLGSSAIGWRTSGIAPPSRTDRVVAAVGTVSPGVLKCAVLT